LLVRFTVGVALILIANAGAVGKGQYTIRPAPTWVRKLVPSSELTNPNPATKSSTEILEDQQIKVSGKSVERYSHFVSRVDNAAGLDDLSQLRFYFEPSYQQLTIHFVRIQRGSSVIDALRPDEIKVIQQEDELDQQLYNGSLEAVIFLNDLRVGDVIDYAYTVSGDNPVLGGKFVDSVYLGSDAPQEMFLRLLYPTNRQLALKTDNTTVQPTKQVIGNDTEYLWYVKNAPPITVDDATPSWYDPYPRVSFSEFQSWNDVVNWALPFYRIGPLKSPELSAKVAEWKNASSLPEERAFAALRFVQDEIRYLGIELGRYSHQPTAPEKVFARRFGDCKDKSFLLSTVLNAMGVEAYPTLVSSYARSTIDNAQPSPFAFDHVIVKAVINGKNYWFDPTISYQRGGLDLYYDPPFERSLVIKDGANALEKIPVPTSDAGSIDVVEIYNGTTVSSPVSLVVTTTYRGMEADQMRYQISTTSPTDLSKMYLNFYADTTPSISADGVPQVEDDTKTNTIVVTERYTIGQLWKQDRHRFYAEKIYAELQKPRVSQRSSPLEVHYPISIKQTVLINIGNGFDFPVGNDVLANDALRFEYRFARNGSQLRMDASLRTFTDVVPLEKLSEHLALLDKAQEFVGFELTRSATLRRGVAIESQPRLPVWTLWFLLVPPLVLLIVWLIRRRSSRHRLTDFAHPVQPLPGASPETALRVSTADQVESTLINFNCRCGHRPYDPGSPAQRERFTYDGQRLLGIQIPCSSCKQTNDLYINVVRDNEPDGLTTVGIG
jgi:hypothetical protein